MWATADTETTANTSIPVKTAGKEIALVTTVQKDIENSVGMVKTAVELVHVSFSTKNKVEHMELMQT